MSKTEISIGDLCSVNYPSLRAYKTRKDVIDDIDFVTHSIIFVSEHYYNILEGKSFIILKVETHKSFKVFRILYEKKFFGFIFIQVR